MLHCFSGITLGLFWIVSESVGTPTHLQGMDPTSALNSHPSVVPGGLEPLLSIAELAEYLGVPIATIYDWCVDHKGPRGIRIGHSGEVLAAVRKCDGDVNGH